jgi:putative ABC transport system permease protein
MSVLAGRELLEREASHGGGAQDRLRRATWVGPYVLFYFYRRRLRVHAVQELLAGLGIAAAVALVFAALVANGSIAGSTAQVIRAVAGPASLQLRARDADGFDEGLLARVERLRGVRQAAPLLEQTATVVGPHARRVTVDLAGTNISLATLNGLAHTLPVTALSPGGIGLSEASARELGIRSSDAQALEVTLRLRGRAQRLKVSAVLGRETFGALSKALVAVMPLAQLQQLAGLHGRITRILVQGEPGREASVRSELRALASSRLTVAPIDQDVTLLRQALHPSDQASALFAAISALLGFLFAFNAMLLTVPERRQEIAEQRLDGFKRTAIVQMVLFQALCLGLAASLVGMLGGYALSMGIFHQSPGYLSRAFTLGSSTVVSTTPLVLSLLGGVLATCVASMVLLLDLRRGRALDAVYFESGVPGNALGEGAQRPLLAIVVGLLVCASTLFALAPSAALIACVVLALATVLAVPLTFRSVLHMARMLATRTQSTLLPLALMSLRARTLRSLALATTGAVALFGAVALGGSRSDLLRGIDGYASNYAGSANIWLVNPADNQAISDFPPEHDLANVARLPGVTHVHVFQGSLLDFGARRVWIIAWPANTALKLLNDQLLDGEARAVLAHFREGSWIAVSQQIASEHHVRVGDTLTVPTPTGEAGFKVAATTTNFGWSPGSIVMSTADYGRAWSTSAPTALGVQLAPGANVPAVQNAIKRALGPDSGLEVLTAKERRARIDSSASEGLSQLGEIASLLVIAAILAMAAALGSSIWQRRVSAADLRLDGTKPDRLRRVMLIESTLMLAAGCIPGVVAGIYGQVVIDGYLRHVTGFPVAHIAAGLRPLEAFALLIAAVLAIIALPVWYASRVPEALALQEE